MFLKMTAIFDSEREYSHSLLPYKFLFTPLESRYVIVIIKFLHKFLNKIVLG